MMSNHEDVIRFKEVSFSYDSKQTLTDLNLKVQKGEFLVVVGPSGSGKSTFLKCINRLLRPNTGELRVLDISTRDLHYSELRRLRRHIGMIFQNFRLVPRKSVLKNVLLGCVSRVSTWKSIFEIYPLIESQRAQELIRQVGLSGLESHRADQLSGGQQQRVAIARALLQDPQIILADEPIASLDPQSAVGIMDHLKWINLELGVTVICSLHQIDLAKKYASRIVGLREGKIVFNGSPNDFESFGFLKTYGIQDENTV